MNNILSIQNTHLMNDKKTDAIFEYYIYKTLSVLFFFFSQAHKKLKWYLFVFVFYMVTIIENENSEDVTLPLHWVSVKV